MKTKNYSPKTHALRHMACKIFMDVWIDVIQTQIVAAFKSYKHQAMK